MELSSEKKALKIAEILSNKKAKDIELLDIKNVSLLSDYFVICSGSSATQVKALADEVEEKMLELGYEPSHKEGYSSASWILLDYSDVVVHIFHYEARSFYNLERLWSDAQYVDIEYITGELK